MSDTAEPSSRDSRDDTSDGDLVTSEDEGTIGRRVGTAIIQWYQQAISPMLPPSCRYQPTCSEYAHTAIERYGLLKGGWMAVKRVLRCHPFHPGGHDPVP